MLFIINNIMYYIFFKYIIITICITISIMLQKNRVYEVENDVLLNTSGIEYSTKFRGLPNDVDLAFTSPFNNKLYFIKGFVYNYVKYVLLT